LIAGRFSSEIKLNIRPKRCAEAPLLVFRECGFDVIRSTDKKLVTTVKIARVVVEDQRSDRSTKDCSDKLSTGALLAPAR
jgi:hypothetical protein